jgi:hypothetical protein
MHSAPRVLEQHNLLGGTDLLSASGKGKRQRARRVHVPSQKRLGFAKALALVVEHGKKQARELGTTSLSRCPRCGHEGPTLKDFGTRIMNGERRPQSWCRGCRAHALPPLHSPAVASARAAKATKAAREPQAARTASAEGWLFPPETLDARPPSAKKRPAPRHH